MVFEISTLKVTTDDKVVKKFLGQRAVIVEWSFETAWGGQ